MKKTKTRTLATRATGAIATIRPSGMALQSQTTWKSEADALQVQSPPGQFSGIVS